ncbi:DUF2785 domain-containing protein [Roseofilum reptotaenium CS-1145]|uniref:DUF2785 domain-containing protein n=1 Tax=Roseofilum reptotaenium AO1-A TaxID=1925591 RepID=A0A1L9QLH2_9CYAN|nr:DUF2785 domain-containing protein [Roseofilum reptotaenium]MDB9517254.1 DUF2785 domain-containing protein [Roseofilum reptotaenium CS-1145]OJJ19737.1 hypothetical protein BI308_21485 [Roseofilum reptotaenium AO1-A]
MDAEFLKSIIENRFAIPDRHQVAELTPKLMANLGEVTWELRDRSYMTLSAWIWGWHDCTYYSDAELLELAEQAKRNIKIGLGEAESDRVFLRTYSILLLNDLTDFDRQHPYLDEPEIRDRMALYLEYLQQEQDLRGYVCDQKGWAHGIAHVADSLVVLGRNPYLNESDLIQLLDGISSKLRHLMASVYLHSEEERLARAAVSICQRNQLTIAQINDWLRRSIEPDLRRPSGRFVWDDFERYPWRKILTDPIEKLCAYRNLQNFLRAFYFQWQNQEMATERQQTVQHQIGRALEFIDAGFYNTTQGFFVNP